MLPRGGAFRHTATMADHAAAAAARTSRVHTDELLRLLDISRRLSMPFDLSELMTLIVEGGRAVIHADRGSVFVYDRDRHELYTVAATGVEGIRVGADVGIAGDCARRREVVIVDDCYADARFNRAMDQQTGYTTRCILSVPLLGLEGELVGVLQMLNAERGRFDEHDAAIAQVLAAQAATAIQRVRLLETRDAKRQLDHDLALARDIQQALLPQRPPDCPGFDLAASSRPADATGGDIYDLALLEHDGDRLVLLLADAIGHGIGPALSVSQLRAMVRLGLRLHADLPTLLRHLNDQLAADLPEGRFVTALLGELDLRTGELRYIAAGQAPLLHLRQGADQPDLHPADTFPLGVVPGIDAPEPTTLALRPGDTVALLTDGYYEYVGPDDELFGSRRVSQVFTAHRAAPAQAQLAALHAAVAAFAQGRPQQDDQTAEIHKRL